MLDITINLHYNNLKSESPKCGFITFIGNLLQKGWIIKMELNNFKCISQYDPNLTVSM